MNHDKLRELAQNATPGPWWTDATCDVYAGHGSCEDLAVAYGAFGGKPRDAEFIAAANPQAILNLLEDLRITRAERDAEKKKLMQMSKDHTTEVLAWDALAEDGRAKAWDEGYEVGCNDGWHDDYKGTTNPYRKDAK